MKLVVNHTSDQHGWVERARSAQLGSYFGNGDECHLAFHFPLKPRMFMAIAEEDRYPIIDIMRQTPDMRIASGRSRSAQSR